MKFKDRMRHLWHDLYFKLFGKPGEEFAMKCQDFASRVDLQRKPKGFVSALRFYTHLSLCKACANYYYFSKFLQKKLQELIKQKNSDVHLKEMNQILIEKYKLESIKD